MRVFTHKKASRRHASLEAAAAASAGPLPGSDSVGSRDAETKNLA